MNYITDSFDQILEFAGSYGLPPAKKRAILREYLQCKILNFLFREKDSRDIFFVGDTALRLLHGLDRFSEDLDFDTRDLAGAGIDKLLDKIRQNILKENINVSLYRNITGKRAYFELRFPDLLFELKISQNKEEKLAVKLDFEKYWHGQRKEVTLLNRFGYLVNVLSIPAGQLLVQKLHAYLARSQTQPRDIYDIIWLISQRAMIDKSFMKKNRIRQDLVAAAKKKFTREKLKLKNFKAKLKPFLIDEKNIERLDLFSQVLETLPRQVR